MTNEQIIRKAVELAEGWEIDGDYDTILVPESDYMELARDIDGCPQIILDALAAQLERQYAEGFHKNQLSNFRIGTPALERICTLIESGYFDEN